MLHVNPWGRHASWRIVGEQGKTLKPWCEDPHRRLAGLGKPRAGCGGGHELIKRQRESLTSSVPEMATRSQTHSPRPEVTRTPARALATAFACVRLTPLTRLNPRSPAAGVATRWRGCSRLAQSLKLLSLATSIWLFKCRAHSSSVAGADCCARAFTLHACRGDRRGRRTRRVDELVAATTAVYRF